MLIDFLHQNQKFCPIKYSLSILINSYVLVIIKCGIIYILRKEGCSMAFINCDFHSKVLNIATSMCVILPEDTILNLNLKSNKEHNKIPTLYLLHGASNDHTIWMRRTSIERYVAEMGIAVVMPMVNRSYYTDMTYGYNYWTFLSEELPKVARSFFPLSDLREDNFVAGVSMGGYGAMKFGLSYPEKFAAIISLSGGLDIKDFFFNEKCEDQKPELLNIFGKEGPKEDEDLFILAEKMMKSDEVKPKIYQNCGTEDFLYEQNVKFRDFARELKIDLTYDESSGDHEWGYFDRSIEKALQWLSQITL